MTPLRHLSTRPLVVGTWSVLLLVLSLTLLINHAPWIGDPLWGQTTVARLQLLGYGLLAGACALDGARDASGMRQLLRAPDLIPRHTWRTIIAWWLPGAVIITLAHIGVVIASSLTELNFRNENYWLLVTQLAGILVPTCFGYALGALAGTWGISIAAGVIWLMGVIGEQAGWFTLGVTEFTPAGTLMGYTPDATFFFLRGTFLLALSLATVGIVMTRGWVCFVSLCVVLTLLAAGRSLFGDADGYTFVESSDTVCVGKEPEICGPSVLRSRLVAGQAIALGAYDVMAETLLASAPQRYDAWSADVDSRHKPAVFLFNPANIRAQIDAGMVIDWVVAPRSCPQWFASTAPPPEWFTAARLVRGFVESRLTGRSVATEYTQLEQLVRDQEQRMRVVRASAQALTRCDSRALPVDALRLLA